MGKIAGVVIGIIIFLVIFFFFPFDSLLGPISTNHKATIVDATIVVPPGQYVSYTATPPYDSNNCKIEGTFSVSGGNDDIRVYVVDQYGLSQLKAGSQFNAYFSTPQQVGGNIVVNIPCEKTVYLVYDNAFSIITNKKVTTKVDLIYNKQ